MMMYVTARVLASYSKSVLWLHASESANKTRHAEIACVMRQCGCAMQAGSFTGALLFFLLINLTGVFVAVDERF